MPIGARVRSLHIRTQRPRVGCTTSANRTMPDAGFHNKSLVRILSITLLSSYNGLSTMRTARALRNRLVRSTGCPYFLGRPRRGFLGFGARWYATQLDLQRVIRSCF